MRHSSTISVLLSLSIVLGVPCAVYSQPAQAPAPAGSADQADTLFRQGNALYKERRYAEAKAAFQQAFHLKKAHDIAANLAYAEMKLNLFRDAAEHLSLAVRIWPPPGKDDKRQYAVERLGVVKKEVAAVTVEVNVRRAEVSVDGKSVGVAPLEGEVFVEPGSRTIEAKLAGYADAKQVIEAAKGSAQTVTLALAASTPVPSVTATSSAAAPPTASSVPTAPPIKGVPRGGPNKGIVIAGGATAGAALIAGVVFTVLANGKAADASAKQNMIVKSGGEDACLSPQFTADCIALGRLHVNVSSFTNAAGWSFVGAGALAAGTLIYTLAMRPKASASTPAVHVAPMLTGQGGGLWAAGRW